jgi:hypothetical protein
MTYDAKTREDALNLKAQKVGLSLRRGFGSDQDLYYLVKREPLSGEDRRVGPSYSLDEIQDFIAEETAVVAALVPTCWRVEISVSSPTRPYECDSYSVIVEVVAKDEDAPAVAYDQASRFISTHYGATASTPTNISASKVSRPDRTPDGNSPEPFPCSVWIEKGRPT